MITIEQLYKHGSEIFGTSKNFTSWLDKPNFYFDGKKPSEFLINKEGIKFIDDQLTGMEYGDNA